jgi:hypothetical protein
MKGLVHVKQHKQLLREFLALGNGFPKAEQHVPAHVITSAKHFSQCGSNWNNIWSQNFALPGKQQLHLGPQEAHHGK